MTTRLKKALAQTTSTHWSAERDRELEALYAAGLPFSAIAGALGVTRNAAIGRVHRLGLELRRGPREKAAPRVLPTPHGCRWIEGDTGGDDWEWCDASTTGPEHSWGGRHRSQVYIRGGGR